MPVLAKNKKAFFDYEILEKYEAGIVLSGAEVKAAKSGQIKLTESFVAFQGETPFLTNAHISRYKKSNPNEPYDPTRSRQLLLHKKEIAHLIGKKSKEGLTIVPLSAYTARNMIKIELGLGRGKKKHDKRDKIKKRDTDRDIARVMKRG